MTKEEKARAAKNEYQRQWRAKNRDKVRSYNERYWLRRIVKMAAESAEQEGAENAK